MITMPLVSLAPPLLHRARSTPALPLLAGLDLPRGSVVELTAPAGLARTTQLALTACAEAQRRSRAVSHDGDARWCGFIDATSSLYAPAVVEAGVALERMLVVRPDVDDVAKVAVRMAASRLFAVLVVDRVGVPGASPSSSRARAAASSRSSAVTRWDIAVRKLALACESSDTTVLLLSDEHTATYEALPVAMRIELTRPATDRVRLQVVKDRRGLEGGARLVSLTARGRVPSPSLSA